MGDFWKPTAEMYSSLFEKPKMAQKLLEKPPFKYIFDIITQTTKVTGFAKGLYVGEQLSADYYSQKERKVNYLQKIINLVQAMSGQQVHAKPQKIVAGLEPQHTNALLQIMHKQATSGNSSDPYVKKILGGGKEQKPTKPQEKPAQKKQTKKQIKPQPPKQQQKSQKTINQKKPGMSLKQQPDLEKKPQVKQVPQPPPEQKKPNVIRPPSAKIKPNQNKAPQIQQRQQPPPPPPPPVVQKEKEKEKEKIIDEDQQQQKPIKSQTTVKPEIQAANYSKKVQQAMEQEKEVQQPEPAQQTGNKITMGKLKKKKMQKIDGGGVVSTGGEITQKQLQLVKNMIQTICQNSTPLGKSIQFVNDDIESMNQELLFWRKQYNTSKTKMQNQLKVTEDALVPLYDKLAEIDEQIKDQKGKIQNVKSQIIKNQSTIRDLLYSVVTTK